MTPAALHPAQRPCSIARVLDVAVLARALRTAIGLRDKVVVVRVDTAAVADPARLEPIAADLALARALGVRMIALVEPAPDAPDTQGPALHLTAALGRHGTTGVAVPAASLVTVHPGMLVVNAMVLVQLCSLGYVPTLFLPLVDLEPAALAAAVARFTDAALLVSLVPGPPAAGALPSPPVVTSHAGAPGQLLADVLLYNPAHPAGPR